MNVDQDRLRKASLENATSLMRETGLQALLVTTMDNVRYITGDRLYFQFDWYIDQYAALLSAKGELIKWTFDLYAAGRHGWTSYPLAPASILAGRWADIFAKALKELGLHEGKIGLDCMSFATCDELRKRLPKVELLPAEEGLLRIRAVKNEDELRLMKKAARIVDVGLEEGLGMMKPGVTENELQARILSATQEAGSEGPSFFGFCSSGKRTLSDLLVTDRKLRRGDPAIFDVGAVFGGYCGDACRTGIVGKASKELRELYVALAEALRNGIGIVKPGIKASEIDRRIRESLKESGYPDYLPHQATASD